MMRMDWMDVSRGIIVERGYLERGFRGFLLIYADFGTRISRIFTDIWNADFADFYGFTRIFETRISRIFTDLKIHMHHHSDVKKMPQIGSSETNLRHSRSEYDKQSFPHFGAQR